MRAGNQLTNAFATSIGNVPECHAGGAVGEEGLVNVTLVGVFVADEPRHTEETLCFVLAKVEHDRHQGWEDGAVVHLWKVVADAQEDLFNRVQTCFV